MDELQEFEKYINSLQRSGRNISTIYEQVQNLHHIVPRLYLLCCVGSILIYMGLYPQGSYEDMG